MCGLAGFLCRSAIDYESVRKMEASLSHRGPDDSGCWVDDSYSVALIHRRLSIQDLSTSGHQPMSSFCGRYVIVFNGEIYNHIEIRNKLKFSAWRGSSDTETLLAAISELGFESTLNLLVGMFSFALWDKQERELFLARDRFGEKPLYYGWHDNVFLFGSELKALKAHASFKGQVDHSSVMLFMENGYIPGPFSIYKGIKKLQPGAWLRVSLECRELMPVHYWDFSEVAINSQQNLIQLDDNEAIERLESLLIESISLQKISDVPIGAFLSGGIDSSTIIALMQVNSNDPVNTFSLGYSDKRYNEANYAKDVAKFLGTNHAEIIVTHKDAISVIPKLPVIYCEPFADTSQIPMYLVSKLAVGHVSVALSGDAGDELFGGYNHYDWVSRLWPRVSRFPKIVRHMASGCLMSLPAGLCNSSTAFIRSLLGRSEATFSPSNRVEILSRFLKSDSMIDAYYSLVANQKFAQNVVLNTRLSVSSVMSINKTPLFRDCMHQMMYLDSINFLTDDILVKTDRAAMAVGLETRIPMLDPRVVEFIWSQPLKMKIRNGQTKWLLRQVLYKYIPKALIERPKMGFGVPVDEWLRGPLLDWVESLLDQNRIHQEGYLDEKFVRKIWRQHLNKKYNWGKQLWTILMFQSWLDANQ